MTLDATRSWHADGVDRIASYKWRLSDGSKAKGATVRHKYDKPGHYSEILEITDHAGRVAYDFAVVQIFDKSKPLPVPPAIHAACWPTMGVKVGDEVTFKVRSFALKPDEGRETWDFGDGSKAVYTRSDGNAKKLARDGYAITKHRYSKAGSYIVSVCRTDARGRKATCRLHLTIGALESKPER
ncbi:MAG: PKD domain-containing protein [Phycisphaerae bacterium]|nr:PKD domain-containing protein [Phycisphaerae bacterium]MDP7289410.1 PKD domain-containing protein [Phycisphaerae bacterium]